jgi:alpha-1,3-rhamnosyl/mannosyltransferase
VHVTLCVDALSPRPGGIGRYAWELCKGLAQSEQINELRYFARGRLIADPAALLTDAKLPRRPRLARVVDRWMTKRVLNSSCVHGPNYFLPPEAESGVITVHDLSVFRYPETHPSERVAAFERLFASSLVRADHIITDTETVRRELIEMHSLAPESISAVPLGADAKFRPIETQQVAKKIAQWDLMPGSYGLSVAAFEPRKKIAELIAAWRQLPARIRETYPLVLAGGCGWRNDELHEQIADATSEGWLRYLGFVYEDDLPALYSGAALFIYPSIYEGFGLPPIEAMASGVPVIVSNRSCLPEVCGDAARYVDPDDVVSFGTAIEECLSDEAWRTASVERGAARAAEFSWRRCVEDTVAVYRRIWKREA